MQPSSSRPLAPALPPLTEAPPDSGSAPPGATPNNATSIKRASTACRSCKQIKRKCDQAHPCSNCRKTHTPCIYNESDDGRRKAARKRTVESLESKRDALDSILDSLRSSDDRNVQTLIQLIRSHAPLEAIVEYATSNADNLPGNQLQNITNVVHGQPRKTVLSVIDLCDTPLVQVPSAPWTNTTSDDEFVSHLMSIYFTWFHVAYPVMDKDLFLQDMAGGSLDCRFCSPFLVNAMLTMACHFSDHPRACKIPSDTHTRGKHFLEEAMRLWNEQEGRPSLLNIQALSILAVSSTIVGKDRLGWSYIEQVNSMQQEFIFKNTQAEARGTQPVSPEVKRSQCLTEWTTFLLTVGFGIAFLKPPMAELPARGVVPSYSILEQNLAWFPYPRRSPEVNIAFDDLYKAHCSLHQIGLDIQQILFDGISVAQEQAVGRLEERLQRWECSLPESLLLSNDSSILKPPIMDIHLTYHWFRVTLFSFVKAPQSKPQTPPDQTGPIQLLARSQTIESASAIAELCKHYGRDFGLKQPTIWMPQTAVSAAYSIVDALSDPIRGLLVQDIFHELCVVLVAASQRWLVMKGHVRMLFVTAEEKGQKLSKKTKDLLKFIALDKWGHLDHLQFASASYPNYALAKDEDPRLAAMGDLLERWASFRINEEGEETIIEKTNALASGSRPQLPDEEDTEGSSPMTTASTSGTSKGEHGTTD